LRTIFFIITVFFSGYLLAQSPLAFYQVERTNELDSLVTSQRSIVIIATDKKDNQWKEYASYLHKAFRVMRIDAVNYIHYLDYNANPTIRQANDRYIYSRQIPFYIFIEKLSDSFRMSIQNRGSDSKKAWYAEAPDLRSLVLELAVTLKRTQHVDQNFLIPLQPEYLSSLSQFEGTRYPNYPTRIKSLKVAIFEIPKLPLDTTFDMAQQEEVISYNKEVERKNQIIRQQLEKYPFKLQLLPVQTEKELYRKGFQYVIYYLNSSGASIREILAYDPVDETEYVSQLTMPDGKRTLTTYEANQTVYKWYIKQTAISDLHVGRYWDAHEDFEKSLDHFINRLKTILK
jgi:hypothetical protein